MALLLDLAWWQRRRDALFVAFTSATLEVRFEGRSETFRSLTDIQKAIQLCNEKIDELGGTAPGAASSVRSTRVDQNDYL